MRAWACCSAVTLITTPTTKIRTTTATTSLPAAAVLTLVGGFLSGGASVLLLILLLVALSAFANRDTLVKGSTHWLIGAMHTLAQLAVALTLVYGFARLFRTAGSSGTGATAAMSLALWLVGGAAAAVVMGVYLFATNVAVKLHDNEAFSIQADQDWKNFLRFHFAPDGSVTV